MFVHDQGDFLAVQDDLSLAYRISIIASVVGRAKMEHLKSNVHHKDKKENSVPELSSRHLTSARRNTSAKAMKYVKGFQIDPKSDEEFIHPQLAGACAYVAAISMNGNNKWVVQEHEALQVNLSFWGGTTSYYCIP